MQIYGVSKFENQRNNETSLKIKLFLKMFVTKEKKWNIIKDIFENWCENR